MSTNVPTTFKVTFENNVRLALQQNKSVLWDLVPERGGTGSELVQLDDIFGQSKAQKGSTDGRHGDTQYNNTTHDNLFIGKPDFDYFAELVDKNDQVQTMIGLQSGYMQAGVATINRARDDAVLGGFFGSMLGGKYNSLTTTAFPSGNVVAHDVGGVSGTATGMNLEKLKAAKKLFGQNYNDPMEEAYMLLTSDDTDQLLNEARISNMDFGASGTELRDGKLRKLFGFEFVDLETENPLFWNAGLLDAGSGDRKTPFWKKSGLARHTWWDINTIIERLPQKHNSIHIEMNFCGAVTRTDSGKVGYILNKRN